MTIALFIIIGIVVGFFIGYSYAYSEIMDKIFSSKANDEPMEISSGNKKATLIVKHIELEV